MEFFEGLKSSRYETLLRHSELNEAGIIMAGTARSLRMDYVVDEETVGALPTATGLVGPLVLLYVAWLVQQAVADGRKRLYFLSRDALILKKVADVVVEKWGLDLDCRYLYCSRESLLLASFETCGEFERNWISWGYLNCITMGEVAKRIGLSLDALGEYDSDARLKKYFQETERPLDREDFGALHDFLMRQEVTSAIRSAATAPFQNTLAYLEQEGMMENTPFALVDTGWRGSSQYAISSLLQKAGTYPQIGLMGYYMGLNSDAWCFRGDLLKGFMFDWRKGPKDYELYNFLCFEMLFGAEHGRTTGYATTEKGTIPLLGTPSGGPIQKLVNLHHRMAVRFAQRALPLLSHDDVCGLGGYLAARALVRAFICEPERGEAEVYGEWPMASEMRESDYQVMAPPMGFGAFISTVLGRQRIKGFWPQASMVRGGLRGVAKAYNGFLRMSLLDWYRKYFLKY